MKRYTQKQAKADISNGFAQDGNILYSIHKMNLNKVLGYYESVAVGYGVYGINCKLIKSEKLGYVAFSSRSTALMYIG